MIAKARPLQSGIAHDGVEMYTAGRFFTMTGRAPENARIVAAPDAFAALAEELQNQAGHRVDCGADMLQPAKYNLSNFTAADRERLKKFFRHLPVESLSDGLKTNIEEIRSAVSGISPSVISTEPAWMRFARGLRVEARRMHNCLGSLVWSVLEGSRYFYRWNGSEQATVCLVKNPTGRWVLHDALGKDNEPLTAKTKVEIETVLQSVLGRDCH